MEQSFLPQILPITVVVIVGFFFLRYLHRQSKMRSWEWRNINERLQNLEDRLDDLKK